MDLHVKVYTQTFLENEAAQPIRVHNLLTTKVPAYKHSANSWETKTDKHHKHNFIKYSANRSSISYTLSPIILK